METNIAKQYRDLPDVQAAESILRKCVHCGFCLATCPTYNLLGDELDSPRGRIYQIKQVLEGVEADSSTQLHLDRCLTCRNCETTCPSGVEYGHLLDVGRQVVEDQVERPLGQRLLRFMIKQVLPYPSRIGPLGRLGIHVTQGESVCCGAIHQHLNDADPALDKARRNIDLWWPHIENGAEAILITASGCGSMVKDYAHLLSDDAQYNEGFSVAFHPPCSMQHGQKLQGRIEALLEGLGFKLLPFDDSQECCGSAGTYSIFQPKISSTLKAKKIANIHSVSPSVIATANIGCQLHLQSVTDIPLR